MSGSETDGGEDRGAPPDRTVGAGVTPAGQEPPDRWNEERPEPPT